MEAMRGASSLISISADSLYTSAMKAVHCKSSLPFRNMSFVTLKSIVDLDTWEPSSCGMAKYLVLYTKLSLAICKSSKKSLLQQVYRSSKSSIKFELLEKLSTRKVETFFSLNEEDLIRKLLSFTRRGMFNNARK